MKDREWAYYKKGIISVLPPYCNISVDKKVLFKQFKEAYYIRWDSDFDSSESPIYYHVVRD